MNIQGTKAMSTGKYFIQLRDSLRYEDVITKTGGIFEGNRDTCFGNATRGDSHVTYVLRLGHAQ